MVGRWGLGDRQLPARIAGVAVAALAAPGPGSALAAAPTAPAAPDEVQPLELVAVDLSRFPRVVFDVALPEHELATDVRAAAFELPGATDVEVEPLDPGALTLAVVLDDGPAVPSEAVALQQGAANELVLNLPRRVELMVQTTSGVQIGPSTDRAKAMLALASARPGRDRPSLGKAMIDAARRLKRVEDPRRQLIVLTGDGADITAIESAAVTAALDQAGAAMRVVAIGAAAGSSLVRTAVRSGGAAIGVDPDPAAAVRAIDVLTATFADQYRVVATLPAAGSQIVRLTVEGRRYETVVPGLGPPAAAPSSSPSTSTSSVPQTTVGPPATPAPRVVAPGAAPTTRAATTVAAVPTVAAAPVGGPTVPDPAADDGRGGRAASPVAAAEAVVALAGVGLVIAAVMRKRRPRPVRVSRYSPKK
jgi:hypothetical protein